MPGAVAETYRDTDYLATGTHKGSTGVTINDAGKDFKSCGVYPGLAVKNITDSTSGHVVSVTEDAVVTDITFHNTDTYEIYMTTTYDSKKATVWIDRRAGHKVTHPREVKNGILVDDVDLDENDINVWGPSQPERG